MSTHAIVTRLLLTLGLCLACVSARADERDPWLAGDKGLHFGVSVALGGAGYGASALVLPKRWQRAALGAAFSISLGGAKELYDLSGRGDSSWRDFTWDLTGTAVGVGLGYLIDLTVAQLRRSTPLPPPAARPRPVQLPAP